MKMDRKIKEIWAGQNRLCLNSDNIISETIVGTDDEKTATASLTVFNNLMKLTDGRVNILIDINRAGKPSREARDIRQQAFNNENVDRVAIVGMNPVANVLGRYLIAVSQKREMRIFKHQDDAVKWFNEP